MQSITDPTRSIVTSIWLIVVLGVVATSWSIWWTFGKAAEPPTAEEDPPEEELAVASSPQAGVPPLDVAAFDVPLWISHAPVVTELTSPEPVEAGSQSLDLQLLAIIRESRQLFAALYDANSDSLQVLTEGQSLGPQTIQQITPEAVEIMSDGRRRVLQLERR